MRLRDRNELDRRIALVRPLPEARGGPGASIDPDDVICEDRFFRHVGEARMGDASAGSGRVVRPINPRPERPAACGGRSRARTVATAWAAHRPAARLRPAGTANVAISPAGTANVSISDIPISDGRRCDVRGS